MTLTVNSRAWTLIILAVIIGLVSSHPHQMPRQYAQHQQTSAEEVVMPNKRPFCNAFTGCGRKRSAAPLTLEMMQQRARQEAAKSSNDEDNLGSLLDLSAEPAVEELSRQIMSEAKLWEAIQEASAELVRRRQDAPYGPYPPAFSTQ